MNGQRFHQQKRIEMKTEQCERSLNRQNCSGCNFTPSSVIILGQMLDRFQIYYPHKIKFANSKIMKICN